MSSGSVTPNIGMRIIPIGSKGWGQSVNNNTSLTDQAFGALMNAYKGEWSNVTVYASGQFVLYEGSVYISTVNANVGQIPEDNPASWVVLTGPEGPPALFQGEWDDATTYLTGYTVRASDNGLYASLQNGNLNNDPTTSPAWWGIQVAQASTDPNFLDQVTFPSAKIASDALLLPLAPAGYARTFEDARGNIAAAITNAGIFQFARALIYNLSSPSIIVGASNDASKTRFTSASTDGALSTWEDRFANVCMAILNNGQVRVANLFADTLAATNIAIAKFKVGATAPYQTQMTSTQADLVPSTTEDRIGNASAAVTKAGTSLFATAKISRLITSAIINPNADQGYAGDPALYLKWQSGYIPVYGQSLSNGQEGTYAITTSRKYANCFMFNGGVRSVQNAVPGTAWAGTWQANTAYTTAQTLFYSGVLYQPTSNFTSGSSFSTTNLAVVDLSSYYASIVPLAESNKFEPQNNLNTAQGYLGETPVSAVFETICDLLVSENGFAPGSIPLTLIGSAPGHGSYGVDNLWKGTFNYQQLINEVTSAHALMVTAGKTFAVPAMVWIQGESNIGTTTSGYLSQLTQIFTDFNADVKAITGQSEDVQFIIYQTCWVGYLDSGFSVALAQLQAAQTLANVHCFQPSYPLLKTPLQELHGPASTYRQFGAAAGRVLKHAVWDGMKGLIAAPSGNSAFVVSGKKITITVGSGKTGLLFDTTNYTPTNVPQPAGGFVLRDASNNVLSIGVRLSGSTITILSPVAVVSGFKLTYGEISSGNVRDDDGVIYTTSAAGITYPVPNYLKQFQYLVP